MADAASREKRITQAERGFWMTELDRLAAQGDFFYGLVYHALVGVRPSVGETRAHVGLM